MKSQEQSSENAKVKLQAGRKTKARNGKTKTKRPSSRRATSDDIGGSLSAYSQQAQHLFGRSKSALNAATGWAEATATQLPNAARNLNVPGQKVAFDFVEQRPLIIGAIGLGIGLVAGALLPKMSAQSTTKRRK